MNTVQRIKNFRRGGRGPHCGNACGHALGLFWFVTRHPKNTNLARIEVLRKSFGLPVGISDDTPGIEVSIAATALGATIIEKHVTLGKTERGVDSEFPIDIQQLTQLVEEAKRAFDSIGSPMFGSQLRKRNLKMCDPRFGSIKTSRRGRS